MLDIGRDPNVYENLVRSFAPSIWYMLVVATSAVCFAHSALCRQMDDVKKGLLCQIVGGTNKALLTGKFR